MKFDWDENKRLENIAKHGIDFIDVPEMFDGPMLVNLDTRCDYGEDRVTTVKIDGLALVCCVALLRWWYM